MSDRNHIVFINQNSGYLMIDIVNAFTQYDQRTLITGKLIERNIPLDPKVNIEKIITYNRSASVKRLFTWCWGFVQIFWLIKTKYRKSDLFIVTNPPFTTFLPLFCKNRFSILVYDVYPDALIAYHYIKEHSFISNIWKNTNKKVFLKADNIFTIGERMKMAISKYVLDETKIRIISNWTDNTFLQPVPKTENKFIEKYQLSDKFLVMYSGNLGHSHNIETLIELATDMQNDAVHFIVIGDGDKKVLLAEMIKQRQLSNCMLLPWQEVAMLPHSMSAADLGVVTLAKEASSVSVPSKTFNLMSVGVPLLCIADVDSELYKLVNEFRIGKCFNASEKESMITFIRKVKADSAYRDHLKQNALQASKCFTSKNAKQFII